MDELILQFEVVLRFTGKCEDGHQVHETIIHATHVRAPGEQSYVRGFPRRDVFQTAIETRHHEMHVDCDAKVNLLPRSEVVIDP
jgi:hypothetical protein